MYLSRIRLKQEIQPTQLAELLKDRKNYGLHRLFWGVFKHDPDKKRDFLFREESAKDQHIESGRLNAAPVYYLLSNEQPNNVHAFFDIESKLYRPKLVVGENLSFKIRVNPVVTRKYKKHDIVMNAQHDWLQEQLKEVGQKLVCKKLEQKKVLLNFSKDAQIESWRKQIEQGCYADKLGQQLGRRETLDWALKTVVEQTVLSWWQKQADKYGFKLKRDDNSEHPIFQSAAYLWNPIPEKGERAGFSSIDLSGEIIVTNVEQFQKLLCDGIGKSKAFGCGLMLIRKI